MEVLLDTLGLGKADESGLAMLRQNRGRLRARRGGTLTFVASGRDDWVGWVELKTEPVNANAIENTGRVIGLVKSDLLAVVEVESRRALRRFSEQMLPQVGVRPIGILDGVTGRLAL